MKNKREEDIMALKLLYVKSDMPTYWHLGVSQCIEILEEMETKNE